MFENGYIRGKESSIDLVDIGQGHRLEHWAARAYKAMEIVAKKDGIIFQINSSFRTMDKQTQLYKEYLLEVAKFQRCERRDKPSPVARPGYSNHQSGYSIDINRAPGDNPATAVPDSPTDIWLCKNAVRYGFYNDVGTEPWHWTFLPEVI